MTWGGPNIPSGLDQFDKPMKPDVRPVDDLSRFVMDQVRNQETEPRIDGIARDYYKHVTGHRYAAKVREDCAVFRRIVALYVDALTAVEAAEDDYSRQAEEDRAVGLRQAVAAIAERFSQQAGFQEEWRGR